jgi:hypothetical protein
MKTRFYVCHDGCTCSGSIIIIDIDKNVPLHLLDKPHVRSGLRKKCGDMNQRFAEKFKIASSFIE